MSPRPLLCCSWGLVVLFSDSALTQLQRAIETNLLNAPGYLAVGAEHRGIGTAGVAKFGLQTAAVANPATISFSALTVNIEIDRRPGTVYSLSYVEYDNTFLLPSFASIGIPLEFGSLQAGYYQPYHERISLGPMPVTTVGNPDSGRIVVPVLTTAVHSGFTGISINVFDPLFIGLTVGVNYADQEFRDFSNVGVRGWGYQVIAGIAAQPLDVLHLGMSVQLVSSAKLEPEGKDLLVRHESSGVLYSPTYKANAPLWVNAGFAFIPIPETRLYVSARYDNWSEAYLHAKDLWQWQVGTEIDPFDFLTVRAGYFTKDYPYPDAGKYYDQQFVTAGISLRVFDFANLTLSYQTSKPFVIEDIYLSYFSYHEESFSSSALTVGVGVAL